jgi:4'-phosphopantetheinyl transferase
LTTDLTSLPSRHLNIHEHGHLSKLTAEDVHVWVALSAVSECETERLCTALSPDERDRASRFAFDHDRKRYQVARGFLRHVLAGYLGIEPADIGFSYSPFGKPELAVTYPAPLSFNLSHAGDYAVCAIALNREVGIDIEPTGNIAVNSDLAAVVFSPAELTELATTPPEEKDLAFLRGWTRKEAYVKGRGQGLSLSLQSFDVSLSELFEPCKVTQSLLVDSGGEWWLYPIDLGVNLICALAVQGSPVQVQVFPWAVAAQCYLPR